MGMYDTYCNITREQWDKRREENPLSHKDTDVDVQLKVGDPTCSSYFIGDKVQEEVKDGLYLGAWGFVAIFEGKVAGVYKSLKNNCGDHICDGEEINQQTLDIWRTLYGKTNEIEQED